MSTSTGGGVQKPLGVSRTPTASASSLLGNLKSFKRNKTPKPPPRVFLLEEDPKYANYPSQWAQFQPTATTTGGPVRLKRPRVQDRDEVHAPWMECLERTANSYRERRSRDKEKGNAPIVLDSPEKQDADEEILVGEHSWESPSDRSATPPSNPDDSLPRAVSPPRPRPRPPLLPPRPQLSSSHSSSSTTVTTFNLPAKPPSATTSLRSDARSSIIPASHSSTWTVLHLGGIRSTLTDLETLSLLVRPHLPKPVAMRISRPSSSSTTTTTTEPPSSTTTKPAFLAYSSRNQARKALEGMRVQFKYDGAIGKQVRVDFSKTPAQNVTWSASETIEAWEELRQRTAKAEEEKKEQKRKQRQREQEDKRKKEEEERQDEARLRLSTARSGRDAHPTRSALSIHPDRRPLLPAAPAPPPPPAPLNPSRNLPPQELLEALLTELRKSSIDHHHPDPPLVTYNPNLDPRKRRKLA